MYLCDSKQNYKKYLMDRSIPNWIAECFGKAYSDWNLVSRRKNRKMVIDLILN
jgi:hypothetical protein